MIIYIYIIFIYTYLKYRESQEGKTNHPKAVVATTSQPTANRPQLKATRRAVVLSLVIKAELDLVVLEKGHLKITQTYPKLIIIEKVVSRYLKIPILWKHLLHAFLCAEQEN